MDKACRGLRRRFHVCGKCGQENGRKVMSTVLVVDDQQELRQLFAKVLENQGHRVLLASNGEEAFQVLGATIPDLILLDMAMPHMDGMSFLKLMRVRPRWSRIPVIVLSGLMTPEQRAAARDLGVTDQLIKAEFSMKELRSRVSKCLAATSAAATAA